MKQKIFSGFCISRVLNEPENPPMIETILFDKEFKKIKHSVKSFRNFVFFIKDHCPKDLLNQFCFVAEESDEFKKLLIEKEYIKIWKRFFLDDTINLSKQKIDSIFEKGDVIVNELKELLQKKLKKPEEEEQQTIVPQDPDIIRINTPRSKNHIKEIIGTCLVDIETGGLDEKLYTLLTLYAKIRDNNGKFVSDISLKLKENNGKFIIDDAAMKVNKINISEHKKEALTYKEGRVLLIDWLYKNTENGTKNLRLMAHNKEFEKSWIIEKDLVGDIEFFFSRRDSICTMIVAAALQEAGVLKIESPSLKNLAKLFNIPYEDLAHDAKNDVSIMEDVYYNHLKPMIKSINLENNLEISP